MLQLRLCMLLSGWPCTALRVLQVDGIQVEILIAHSTSFAGIFLLLGSCVLFEVVSGRFFSGTGA